MILPLAIYAASLAASAAVTATIADRDPTPENIAHRDRAAAKWRDFADLLDASRNLQP